MSQKYCIHCGAPSPLATSKFCGSCGKSLDSFSKPTARPISRASNSEEEGTDVYEVPEIDKPQFALDNDEEDSSFFSLAVDGSAVPKKFKSRRLD